MKEIRTHEALNRDHDTKMGSEKSFGLVFAVVFALIGLIPPLHGGEIRLWALAVAAVFAAFAFFKPQALHKLNVLWFKFGLLLHKIVSPVIMALIFFIVIVPPGLIRQMLGKDPLRLKKDPAAKSYWIVRDPAGPDASSMERQF